jgi:DNA-binding transcriptional MocR family regulator
MPLYETIAEEIKARIRSGRYKPGEKIPSIRAMALAFECNKLTVQRAFGRLKEDGFLENVVGSGSFVRFPEKIGETNHLYDFKSAYVSEVFFPYREARTIFADLFDREKSRALAPTPVAGDPDLLRVLGGHYRVPTKRMFIVSGAQQGLDLTAKVFSTRISEASLFEDPTYPGAISLFRPNHFVPLQDDGPDLDRFDRRLSTRIKLFYAMPTVHNPTGIAYSLAKKEAIARRAERSDFYIIEDDYLSEYQERPTPRFIDMIPEKTIYIKSLSPTTVPDIRLGFMVVPDNLYDKFLYAKYTSDVVSTGLLQKFVKEFIQGGGYAAYLRETRKKIRGRKRELLKILAHFPSLTIPEPQQGYSLWVRSAHPLDLPHSPWSPGKEFSFSPQYRCCFRLSFMNMDDATFDEALGYLRDLLNRIGLS